MNIIIEFEKKNCQDWLKKDLENFLVNLNLPKTGKKDDLCKRILDYKSKLLNNEIDNKTKPETKPETKPKTKPETKTKTIMKNIKTPIQLNEDEMLNITKFMSFKDLLELCQITQYVSFCNKHKNAMVKQLFQKSESLKKRKIINNEYFDLVKKLYKHFKKEYDINWKSYLKSAPLEELELFFDFIPIRRYDSIITYFENESVLNSPYKIDRLNNELKSIEFKLFKTIAHDTKNKESYNQLKTDIDIIISELDKMTGYYKLYLKELLSYKSKQLKNIICNYIECIQKI